MNDFTKEELEDLITWANVYKEFGHSWTDKIHRPLINKIQSLIDNYCDHKNPWPLYTTTGDIPAAAYCYECGKPVNKEFINDNQ